MSLHTRHRDQARSLRRAALAVALIAALVVAVLVVPRALDDGSQGDTIAQARRKAAAHVGKRGARGERDVQGQATCWTGLDRFDTAVTLASFRAWAAPLIAAGDPLVVAYLVDRLAELVGDDEERAREVLGWVRDADGDELWLVLEGLERSPAIHRPAIADALAQLGLDPMLDPERRTAVVAALDTQRQLAPEILDGLAGMATTAEPGEAGWVAARTVGRVMAQELGRGGDAAPYLDRLLAIGAESPDAQVRSVALEMPMYVDTRVDGAAASRLAGIISADPDLDVRMTAIHDLSLALDRDKALQVYETAFRVEHDVCVRWALFRFSARVAGARALPVMARMAQVDARFAEDHRTFERIYASGVVDFERVWQSLPNDDPHNCLAVEGEGEGAE
jgi:hypothetical protein